MYGYSHVIFFLHPMMHTARSWLLYVAEACSCHWIWYNKSCVSLLLQIAMLLLLGGNIVVAFWFLGFVVMVMIIFNLIVFFNVMVPLFFYFFNPFMSFFSGFWLLICSLLFFISFVYLSFFRYFFFVGAIWGTFLAVICFLMVLFFLVCEFFSTNHKDTGTLYFVRGTNLMQQLWFIIINDSTGFGHLYANLQECRLRATAYGVQH